MIRETMASWFGVFVPVREPHPPKLYAGAASVRLPVQVIREEPPDPAQQGGDHGRIPARPAMIQTYTAYHDQNAVSAENFQAIIIGPDPRAQFPRGRQLAWRERANIDVPTAVAYGSLFTSAEPTYGFH